MSVGMVGGMMGPVLDKVVEGASFVTLLYSVLVRGD